MQRQRRRVLGLSTQSHWHRLSHPGLLIAVLVARQSFAGAEDGLVPLPPMGYNTWNDLECKPGEKKILKIADRLKKLGLLSLGYKYITVGDCWMGKTRDENGKLTSEPELFPGGMAAVAKYVHNLGFKFGIYTDRGPTTCVGFPASMGSEEIDAQTFAEWGVDFVKNDGCWDPDCGVFQPQFPGSGTCDLEGRKKAIDKYAKMAESLSKTGRDIVHSVSGWQPWYAQMGTKLGHMWRISADVRDWEDVYQVSRIMEQLGRFHGPNSYNDPDMLIGSSQGAKLLLTPIQSRAQFSLWVVMAAPLILGANVLHMNGFDVETYSNKDAIRINQDPLVKPGKVVISTCPAYPELHLSEGSDGFPVFRISGQAVLDEVVCGSHTARSCSECPRGHGQGWCHGDCRWIPVSKRCVPQQIGVKKDKAPPEETPDGWSLPTFRRPDMRECQQVWAKVLRGGDVAIAAINWGSELADMQVPLSDLGLPWAGNSAMVQDIWYKGPLQNPSVISGQILLRLKPDGGHALLRLREMPNGTVSIAAPIVKESAVRRPMSAEDLVDKDFEMSPAEERLRQIAERHKSFRKRITDEMLEDPEELLSPFWVMPMCIGLTIVAILVLLAPRIRILSGCWLPGQRPDGKST